MSISSISTAERATSADHLDVHAEAAAGRMGLGGSLRQLREARSLRLEDVALSLGVAPSTLSRIETGKAPTRIGYLHMMLDLYGITDPGRRRELADLARAGQRKEWWADWRDLLPPGADTYLRLEAAATHMRVYSGHVLPGILHTIGYAAAAWQAAHPRLTAQQAGHLAGLTMRRKGELRRNGTRLHVVIDESALVRPIAPSDIMADQLSYLDTAPSSTITIQVVRLGAATPALSPDFSLLSLPGSDRDVVGYRGPGHVLTSSLPTRLQAANAAFAALADAALSPAATGELISMTSYPVKAS
jgi:transcriptional regulator with XRE-family HTH domain